GFIVLASVAVSITARMVTVMIPFALLAFINLPSHNRSAAQGNINYGFVMRGKNIFSVFTQISFSIASKYV
ncbi:MAG TPA: hypothetical protein VMV36_03570, partial [Ignavibacteriaceae bacterium]|nr:hypothetical protein [Ignavibacteriaceae bacterium]